MGKSCSVATILVENGIDPNVTISAAISFGYLQATVISIFEKLPDGSFGRLAELRKIVGKGVGEIDYRFGLALVQNSMVGSQAFYEGLSWMNSSFGIPVLCAEDPSDLQGVVPYDGFYFSSNGMVVVRDIPEWKKI